MFSSRIKCFVINLNTQIGRVHRVQPQDSIRLCRNFSSENNGINEDEVIWDAIISGGGLVGSAMACSVGNSIYLQNKKILLLESGKKIERTELSEKYSNRVTALNPGTKSFLSDLGVWENVCAMRVKPVKKMQVWEACSTSCLTFQNSAMIEDMAYIAENDVLLRSLAEKLEELKDKVTIWHETKAVNYQLPKSTYGSDVVNIQLEDGRNIKGKMLIGADGYNSLVRRSMGVQNISWNYKQKAIVATLNFAEPIENNMAWQKFLPTGPIAFLPLTDTSSSLVWTVSPKMADELMKMEEDAFTDVLNDAMWKDNVLNPVVKTITQTVDQIIKNIFPSSGSVVQLPPHILSIESGSRAHFPLGLGHAVSYVAPQVALIGDAAHRVHPLAGLGVNLGFGDVKCLTEKLNQSVFDGNHIGYLNNLHDYETQRLRHNVPISVAIDGLNRIYSNDLPPIVLIRSIGAQLTNICLPLKKQFIEMASR